MKSLIYTLVFLLISPLVFSQQVKIFFISRKNLRAPIHEHLVNQQDLLKSQARGNVTLQYFFKNNMKEKRRTLKRVKSPGEFLAVLYKGTLPVGKTWSPKYKAKIQKLIMNNIPLFMSLNPSIWDVLDLQDILLENQLSTESHDIRKTTNQIIELKRAFLPRIKTVPGFTQLVETGSGANAWANTSISDYFKNSVNALIRDTLPQKNLNGTIRDYLRLESYVLTLQTSVGNTIRTIRVVKEKALGLAQTQEEKDFALQLRSGNPHNSYIRLIKNLK